MSLQCCKTQTHPDWCKSLLISFLTSVLGLAVTQWFNYKHAFCLSSFMENKEHHVPPLGQIQHKKENESLWLFIKMTHKGDGKWAIIATLTLPFTWTNFMISKCTSGAKHWNNSTHIFISLKENMAQSCSWRHLETKAFNKSRLPHNIINTHFDSFKTEHVP